MSDILQAKTFGDIFDAINDVADEALKRKAMQKQALEDSTVLTRTDPMEVGTVPAVNEDLDDAKKDKGDPLTEIVRKKDSGDNPSRKREAGEKKEGVNEPTNPAGTMKLSGKGDKALSTLKKLFAAAGKSENLKRAGSNDLQAVLKDLLEKASEEVEEDEEEEYVETEENEDENENETEEEEMEKAEAAGKHIADILYLTKHAAEIEDFVKNAKAEEQARQKQDYEISVKVGEQIAQMEDEFKKMAEENKSLKTELEAFKSGNGISKIAGTNGGLDPYAAKRAQAEYTKALTEKQAADQLGIDPTLLRTIQFVKENSGPDFQKKQ
jgi:hypothetical protein